MKSESISTTTSPIVSTRVSPWAERGFLVKYIRSEAEQYSIDDWDGCGALAVTNSALNHMADFVSALPRVLVIPAISAGYDGSIGLAWDAVGMTMFANIPAEGPVDFTFNLPLHEFRYSKQMEASDPGLSLQLSPVFAFISVSEDAIDLAFYSITSTSAYNVMMSYGLYTGAVGLSGHDLPALPGGTESSRA